jgi:hypothetical protein
VKNLDPVTEIVGMASTPARRARKLPRRRRSRRREGIVALERHVLV